MGLRTSKVGVVTVDRVLGQKDEVGKGLGGRMWPGCAQVTGGYIRIKLSEERTVCTDSAVSSE